MNKLKTKSGDWARSNTETTVGPRYWALAWVSTSAPAAFCQTITRNINILPTFLAGMIAARKKYQ